jgi:hypothetical protein
VPGVACRDLIPSAAVFVVDPLGANPTLNTGVYTLTLID